LHASECGVAGKPVPLGTKHRGRKEEWNNMELEEGRKREPANG